MTWGTVTIAGVPLRETITWSRANGSLAVSGQESHPPSLKAAVIAAEANVSKMTGLSVPVTFSDKPELNGWYSISDARTDGINFAQGSIVVANWQIGAVLLGAENDMEVESRVPTVARLNDFGSITPVYWHAPAVGFEHYFTGPSVPASSVTRLGAEGSVIVQTGIPVGFPPRWRVALASYYLGSSRLLIDTVRRIGLETPPSAVWEVNNSLVKITPAGGGSFTVSCFASNVWESPKTYSVTVNGSALTDQPDLTVIRNDPEEVIVRLSFTSTVGLVTLDLSLRRGSRFVTGILKRHAAATLGIARTAAETAVATTGGLRASAADLDGNRFVMGSARTANVTLPTAALSKTGVLAFDFFLGHEINAAPAAGDAFVDLMAQYLGTSGERARAVRR